LAGGVGHGAHVCAGDRVESGDHVQGHLPRRSLGAPVRVPPPRRLCGAAVGSVPRPRRWLWQPAGAHAARPRRSGAAAAAVGGAPDLSSELLFVLGAVVTLCTARWPGDDGVVRPASSARVCCQRALTMRPVLVVF